MNTYLSMPDDLNLYRSVYPNITVIRNTDSVPDDIDLLIVPGGSDVNPAKYGQKLNGAYGIDSYRDDLEFEIIRQSIRHNPEIRLLGICRGCQVLGVLWGGELFQDLGRIGLSHKPVHDIVHHVKNSFSWLTSVNSLHHQAVCRLGSDSHALAHEPSTDILEIIKFGSYALGVQFHPEMFGPELRSKFFAVITDWVTNKTPLVEPLKVLDLRDRDVSQFITVAQDWVDTTTNIGPGIGPIVFTPTWNPDLVAVMEDDNDNDNDNDDHDDDDNDNEV